MTKQLEKIADKIFLNMDTGDVGLDCIQGMLDIYLSAAYAGGVGTAIGGAIIGIDNLCRHPEYIEAIQEYIKSLF